MKTGHYHKQHFYKHFYWEAFRQSTVFMHKDNRGGNTSFSLRKWAEFSKCCRGDVFPECLHVSGDQLLQELWSQKPAWQSLPKDAMPPCNLGTIILPTGNPHLQRTPTFSPCNCWFYFFHRSIFLTIIWILPSHL